MTYRNVTKMMTAAVAAAVFAVGLSGVSVHAQQFFNSGSPACSSCSQTISFPTVGASSMPLTASDSTYPTGQVIYSSTSTATLPVGSSIVGSTVGETYATYPNATYASGSTVFNEGLNVQATGTLTSVPAATYAAAPVYSQPAAPVYTQPVAQPVYTQPAQPVYTQPVVQPVYTQPESYSQPVSYSAPRATPIRSTISTGYQAIGAGVGAVSSGLAQRKAQQAANGRIRGHVGGGLGGAKFEGVGWSSQSPQSAIEHCCYWGTRPTAQIGVSRGPDGLWYACVLYN